MLTLQRGQIVFSKAGRDKGKIMVVLASENEFLTLADGKHRTLQNPKKKKLKHVQPTKTIIQMQPACGRALQDADIRKALKLYESSNVKDFLNLEGG
ncbi:MAG: KOW domain-containing RNA-binding protein [Defluviitaleaceae bacterium]|nr:KOW domain-containing RNA-binding protein [Defluviitaleaceae bacterium]